jgi:hypothetical protein
VPVTIDNYNRAQSDVYFALIAKGGAFGKFRHGRDLAPIGQGGIIRPNRDTLYSLAVFDLDAGPVTITLPDPDKHFMTMQIISEDQYTQPVYYGAGSHTLTREMIGTRYAGVAVRVLVDPRDKNELQELHFLQDAIKVNQQNPGTFLTGMKQVVRRCKLLFCSLEQRFQIRGGCTVPTRIKLIL